MIYQFKVVIFRGKMGDLTTKQDIFLLGKMVIQRSDVFGICHQQDPFGCLKRWYTPQTDNFRSETKIYGSLCSIHFRK